MEKHLTEVFPIWAIQHDSILSTQGDFTVAFEIIKPEIFTLSGENYASLHQAMVKALKILPQHSVFHMQDWFATKKYQSDGNHADTFLSRASERYFHERPYLDHRAFIYLTKKVQGRKQATSAVSGLFRKNLVPPETLHPLAVQDFLDIAGQFKRILEDSRMLKLRRLTDDDIWSYAGKAGVLEQYYYLTGQDEYPVIRDINLKDGITVGDRHCLLYTLADAEKLPSLCGPSIHYDRYSTDRTKFRTGYASVLGQLLGCNHIYNQVVHIGDSQATLKKLEAKRLRLQSLSNYSRENAIGRDAVTQFLNEAIAEQRLPVRAHFNVLAWSDNPDELKDIKNRVSSALVQMEASPHLETVGAAQIWWSCIPGNAADLPSNEMFDNFAETAACFFNMETSYRSSVSPVGLRLGDRLSGRPLNVDISDEPVRLGITSNRNKFILGPSGSGKSFFCNAMVRTYYEQGTHVVLVDVGHSYRGLCNLVNGYYFTYTEADPIRFNPFFLSQGDVLDTEKRESIKTLLLALWKKDDETFNRSEYVALSNALQLYFDRLDNNKDIFPCFNTFYEFLQEDFTKVLVNDRVKEKDFDIDNFLFVLRPFYKGGEFDYLLNATEQLDLLNERFIVFELDNIKDHPILFPIVTIIIMEVFISKMRKLKGVRKMILIEEAWKALMKEGFAEYIKYLFKTVRKFFGEAIVVTQEVEDIISSPVVKQAIINNSDCKILLDQSKYQNKFDDIQNLLALTDKEKSLVLSINKDNDPKRKYKEVFIGLGSTVSKVYRTEVSLEEYLAYTTEESEKIKVAQYAEKYGSYQKGIEMLAAETRSQQA